MGFGGRNRLIDSPETFKELTQEYFDWVKANPVMKTVTASFQGEISYLKVPHTRGMTQFGLAAHMGIGLTTLKNYAARPEFSPICDDAMTYIKHWNADLAMTGEINASLVARLDGHVDKQDLTSNGQPIGDKPSIIQLVAPNESSSN